MTQNFYFDTSIWLDYYEKRGMHGKTALSLIVKIVSQDAEISYSDLSIKELKHLGYPCEEIINLLCTVKPQNMKRIHIFKEQIREARNLARQRGVPNNDALHAILCRDNNLQLVSRDSHFEKLKDVSMAKTPEELI